jgi:hypothetical protein
MEKKEDVNVNDGSNESSDGNHTIMIHHDNEVSPIPGSDNNSDRSTAAPIATSATDRQSSQDNNGNSGGNGDIAISINDAAEKDKKSDGDGIEMTSKGKVAADGTGTPAAAAATRDGKQSAAPKESKSVLSSPSANKSGKEGGEAPLRRESSTRQVDASLLASVEERVLMSKTNTQTGIHYATYGLATHSNDPVLMSYYDMKQVYQVNKW